MANINWNVATKSHPKAFNNASSSWSSKDWFL